MNGKLQADISFELLQKIEARKTSTKKSKAAIITEALQEYFERLEKPEIERPFPPFHAMEEPVRVERAIKPQDDIVPPSGPASIAELFPDEPEADPAPALRNFTAAVHEDGREEELQKLKRRLAASRSGREIDELSKQIAQIEGARTIALLDAMPGPDPSYVASMEANERRRAAREQDA
jgi:hypothetical protein